MNEDPNFLTKTSENRDYDENVDITRLHAAVSREKEEPSDGNEPLSVWYVLLVGLFLFAGGGYLTLYSGGFRADEYSIYGGPGKGKAGAATEEAKEELTLAQQGEKVYKQNCAACHQATGNGVPGSYPPLAGAEWVNGGEKRLAAIVLNGLQGEVTVAGQTYNGAMPAWSNLNDQKLAAVLTYVRSAWGNSASEISVEKVAAAREEFKTRTTPWTAADLEAIPADAALPGGDAAPAGDAAPQEGSEQALEG